MGSKNDRTASARNASTPAGVLSIAIEMDESATVLVLDGPVCAYTAPHLDSVLSDVDTDRIVIVDATAVPTMATAGLSVVADHADRCRAAGSRLLIRNPSGVTRRVLAVLDPDGVLDIEDVDQLHRGRAASRPRALVGATGRTPS